MPLAATAETSLEATSAAAHRADYRLQFTVYFLLPDFLVLFLLVAEDFFAPLLVELAFFVAMVITPFQFYKELSNLMRDDSET